MNVTSKGQVTIPKEIRVQYHIDENTEVDFVSEDGKILLIPRPPKTDRFERVQGKADTGLTTDEIMKLTRGEDD
jgi:antitoxin PrlF